MNNKLTIEYPDTIPDTLQESKEQFENEARMAMAVKLFEWKRLSSGMAASLAGMDRVSFLLNLQHYGVPMIDVSEDQVISDMNNA